MSITSLHHFSYNGIRGNAIPLSYYKGKPMLIVNTASECGFTKQYSNLQELHERYNERITVIAFPSDDFGNQEPGSNEDIAHFCSSEYGVTFPLAEKTTVIGEDIHPVFSWLTSQDNADFTGEIKWNFEKFIVNEDGILIARFRSATEPLDPLLLQELGIKL